MKKAVNIWHYISVYLVGLTALLAIFLPVNATQKCLLDSITILFLHFFEEFGYPGGFPLMGMKVMMNSDEFDYRKWDCNNLNSMFGNWGFLFLTFFRTMAWLRYRRKGKQTVYGPGSITAYLGFGVFGVILWHCMDGRSIGTSDWIICALIILFIVVCCVLGPETIMKKRDNPYYFKTNGYYDRFVK